MVQTILECLNGIGNIARTIALTLTHFLLYLVFLSRAGKLSDNFHYDVNAFGERSEWDALIVAVHAF